MSNNTRAKPLTHKQEKFVLAVVEGMTQADAYRHAYNTDKMTPKSIHEKASVLMADVKVKSRYDELMDKVRKSAEDKAIITVEEVLKEIKDLLGTDITDIADFKTIAKKWLKMKMAIPL